MCCVRERGGERGERGRKKEKVKSFQPQMKSETNLECMKASQLQIQKVKNMRGPLVLVFLLPIDNKGLSAT